MVDGRTRIGSALLVALGLCLLLPTGSADDGGAPWVEGERLTPGTPVTVTQATQEFAFECRHREGSGNDSDPSNDGFYRPHRAMWRLSGTVADWEEARFDPHGEVTAPGYDGTNASTIPPSWNASIEVPADAAWTPTFLAVWCISPANDMSAAPTPGPAPVVWEIHAAADADEDHVADDEDNCPYTPNQDQSDADANGVGDACDDPPDTPSDADGDGVPDDEDNCASTYNPDQADSDANGVGDACDDSPGTPSDTDGDGVQDGEDNCPWTHNSGQADSDANGVGDACEDGVAPATPAPEGPSPDPSQPTRPVDAPHPPPETGEQEVKPDRTGYFFIHGICSDGGMWTSGAGQQVWRSLTDDGALPHWNGTYGGDTHPSWWQPANMHAFLNDELVRFIDDRGLSKVILIGHSNGGLMARWLYSDPLLRPFIDRVVTLDSPDIGIAHGAGAYWAVLGAAGCDEAWRVYTHNWLDRGTGDVAWMSQSIDHAANDPRVMRLLYVNCEGTLGSVNVFSVFTGPSCNTQNLAVSQGSASWADAVLLAYAAPMRDPGWIRDAAATACTEPDDTGSGPAMVHVVAGADPSLVAVTELELAEAFFHVSGTDYFASDIVAAARHGALGLAHVGSFDCHLVRTYGLDRIGGVVTVLGAGGGSPSGAVTATQAYQEGVAVQASVTSDAISVNVRSDTEHGKIILIRVDESTWTLGQALGVVVRLDGKLVPMAADYEAFRSNAQTGGGALYHGSLGTQAYEFQVFVPRFSERMILIGPAVEEPSDQATTPAPGVLVLLLVAGAARLWTRGQAR